jgi:hypothetical protein
MAGHGKKNVDDVLLLALASGASVAAAAEHAKCSERTVRRRMQDAGFREAVRKLRAELLERAVGRLTGLGLRAADQLGELMDHGEREQTRLGAARATLAFMLRGTELVEIEQRLANLEEAAEAARQREKGR